MIATRGLRLSMENFWPFRGWRPIGQSRVPSRFGEMSPEQGQVDFFHFPALELALELLVGLQAAGRDDHARGLPVEAMDDPEAVLGPDPADFRKMEQEGVDQRPEPASRARDGRAGRSAC